VERLGDLRWHREDGIDSVQKARALKVALGVGDWEVEQDCGKDGPVTVVRLVRTWRFPAAAPVDAIAAAIREELSAS
jgi:hypothetical protein